MSEDGTAPRIKGRFAPGQSGNPRGSAGRARRADTALVPAAPAGGPPRGLSRFDADWVNFFTGQGVWGRDKRLGAHFNVTPLSFDQLMHLWLGDDLAARAVETIPKEAMREGYDLTVSDSQEGTDEDTDGLDPSEAAAEVQDELERLGADDALEIAASYERGYGGGAILLGANDKQTDLTKPLVLDRVASFDYLNPLEARECMPVYAYGDPNKPKYGQPEIYRVITRSVLPSRTGYSAQTMDIHESRLILFPGIRVSRFQPLVARGGWGEAVLTRIYRVLRDFNAAYSNAGVLINDFAQAVIKIAGLWDAIATDGEQAFENRLRAMDQGRSTINAIAIDAGDSYERQQTPMAGLSDILERFAVRLAAACDMPLTLLFGTSPAGLNATGESDIRSFYDRVAAYQRRVILPRLRTICQIIFRTIGSKREPEKWSIKFRPLWQESEKDKAAAFLTRTQADVALITASVVSPEEVAKSHWGKGEYDPNLNIDFAAREEQEAAAAAPVTPEDRAALDPNADAPNPNAPPSAPGAPDPNTPPVRTVKGEDSATAVRRDRARRRDADWDESKHPRAPNGEFGSGGGGGAAAAVSTERAEAAMKDREFFHTNAARLSQAASESNAKFPREEQGRDHVSKAAVAAMHEEAKRILAENDATGNDKDAREIAEARRWYVRTQHGGDLAAQHEAAMQRIAEHQANVKREAEDQARFAAAEHAGAVPTVPDVETEHEKGAVERDKQVAAIQSDLQAAHEDAVRSLAHLESAADPQTRENLPSAQVLADQYLDVDNHLKGNKEGGDGDRYQKIIDEAPEKKEVEPHESLNIDDDGNVQPWEPPSKGYSDEQEFGLNWADDEVTVKPWTREFGREYDVEKDEHDALAKEYKQHAAEDKAEYEKHAAEYEAARGQNREQLKGQALETQSKLEALYAKQVAALQQITAIDKAHDDAREKAQNALPDEDLATEHVLAMPAFHGRQPDEETGEFADPATEKLFQDARDAYDHKIGQASGRIDDRAVHAGEDQQSRLQDAIGETKSAIRSLSDLTGRAPALGKAKRSKRGDSRALPVLNK